MRSPERVLNNLTEHSKDLNYRFERLYRILFNEEMFLIAYENIHSKPGNMTKGTDGKTADHMNTERIGRLIESLKDETYQPKPSRRVYIPKKNGTKRPLGIPSFDDKLVQEVVRMVLEAIYEPTFERSSHGFRPYRSCHTALTSIQNTFTGARWFIEGDIKGFFDNIEHRVLIDVLRERIDDGRFIRLIWKFLKAGYMESWKFHNTYSGTPQGGIISPILANIYLDKLDKYMKEYSRSFDRGHCRRISTQNSQNSYRTAVLRKKLKEETDEQTRTELIKAIKELGKQKRELPSGNEMDEKFRRLKYVRYADDFLISVIGSKAECVKIKSDIARYLNDTLKLELSESKTLITNAKRPAKFLGFDVSIRKTNCTKRNKKGFLERAFNDRVVLTVTFDTMRDKLQKYDVVTFKRQNRKEAWIPKSRGRVINMEPIDMLRKYNAEIRGLYNYYSIANNSSSLHSFFHIMKMSMCKTMAQKQNTTKRKILQKHSKNGVFTLPYLDKKGNTRQCTLYNEGFKRKRGITTTEIDLLPKTFVCHRTNLRDKLKARTCELCGNKGDVIVRQVRSIKALKGVFEWEQKMIHGNRKTLVVCYECSSKISQNQTDGINGKPYTLKGVSTVWGRAPGNQSQKCYMAPSA